LVLMTAFTVLFAIGMAVIAAGALIAAAAAGVMSFFPGFSRCFRRLHPAGSTA
jgi:hypothetical protein